MLKASFVFELVILIVITVLFILTYRSFINQINKSKSTIVRKLVSVFFVFMFLLFTIITIKHFIFDVYKISDVSMESALFSGDVILVNKLKYGAIIHSCSNEIPSNISESNFGKIKKRLSAYQRTLGLKNICKGDVIVFNSVHQKNEILVKRCVATSGDTLHIRKGHVYTNNKLFTSDSVKNIYTFKVTNEKTIYKIVDSLSMINIGLTNTKDDFYQASLSKMELGLLKKLNCIDSLTINQIDTFDNGKKIFCSIPKWSINYMGPFIVPKKRMKVKINHIAYSLYKKTINDFENCTLEEIDGNYFVDGKKIDSYTFKQDYYFMIGDNWNNSMDSRQWGFLPENKIIGKVRCVLFSDSQWSRFLKVVN